MKNQEKQFERKFEGIFELSLLLFVYFEPVSLFIFLERKEREKRREERRKRRKRRKKKRREREKRKKRKKK